MDLSTWVANTRYVETVRERPEINTVDRSHGRNIVAVGDEYGRLRLYRYPCLKENASCLEYQAHSPHIMKVRWANEDKFLFSVGGQDRSIMQWRHVIDQENRDDADLAGDSGDDSALPHESRQHYCRKRRRHFCPTVHGQGQ